MADDITKKLHYFCLFHKHDLDVEKIPIDHDVLSCMKTISQIDVEPYLDVELPHRRKVWMTRNAKRFMTERFSLHPVGYLSNSMLKRELIGKKIQEPDDVANIFNQAGKMIDPFHLPIRYNINNVFGGSIIFQDIDTDDSSFYEELLPKLNSYFRRISLPKKVTSITPTSYVHEITHSQLDGRGGIINDFYNGEVLSIFMEFLHSYETNPDCFKADYINRIEYLLHVFSSMFLFDQGQENPKREYTENDYYFDSLYFVSILKAIHLFHIYDSGNNNVKKLIIYGIQMVFDGKISLEELLSSLGISYPSSLDGEFAKYFIKKIHRRII